MAAQSRALTETFPTTLLLTRPLAASARFAALVEARHPGQFRALTSPLILPEWVEGVVPRRDWTAVLLTSETGAEAAARRQQKDRLPRVAFCVGNRTAEVAAAAGFETHSANGDATALIALVTASRLPGPMIHLRGRDTRGDLVADLASAGIEAASVIVYDQIAQPLTQAAKAALQGKTPVLLPLFSPRTAQILVAEAMRLDLTAPLFLAAISPAVAEAMAPLPHVASITAAAPNAPAMVDAISRLLGESRRS